MIDREVFYQRLGVCKGCEWWRNVCLKGHPLQSPVGCPVKKFAPVDNAGYHPDSVVVQAPPPPGAAGCCGQSAQPELRPLTWAEAWKHFQDAMAKASAAGWPLVTGQPYNDRVAKCKGCPAGQYVFFQCRHCKCVVYSKALLATESCPFGHWPR